MLPNQSIKDLDKQAAGLASELKHVPVGSPEFTRGAAQLREVRGALRDASRVVRAREGKGFGSTF